MPLKKKCLTCKNSLMSKKFFPLNTQNDITEFLIFKKISNIIRQVTVRNFELNSAILSRYIDRVSNNTYLFKKKTLFKKF